MTFGVEVFPQAEADIRRNADWMRLNLSPAQAARWGLGIASAIAALANNPEQHPEAEEAADLSLPLRCKLYRRRRVFRILFVIDGETVNVHRVRHAAQDHLTEEDL